MEDTVFAKIVTKEIPAEIIYEDENTLAFLDIMPDSLGHTLVIPKKSCRNIFDVDEETFAAVMRAVRMLAPIIKESVAADGMRIIMNNEKAGGQVVFHLHVHMIPFFNEKPPVFEHKEMADAEKLKALGDSIRAKLV